MKIIHRLLLAIFVSAVGAAHALAQGSLTPPPGPIAPTMKSLDQVEPARPLVAGQPGVAIDSSTGGITLSVPGSYYLTGNLTISSGIGINVSSSDVFLDLRGYSISTTANNGTGIAILNGTRIDIRNGSIRGSSTISGGTLSAGGFSNGVSSSTNAVIHVTNVLVEGVSQSGIFLGLGQPTIVESCIVRTADSTGINAGLVIDSMAVNVLGTPINCTSASNCVGKKSDGTTLISQTNPTGETRTVIASAPYTISTSGSYYLGANLAVASGDAINITARDVTLDLNGYSIVSTATTETGRAITVAATAGNVTIRNGSISGNITNGGGSSDTFSGGGFATAIFSNASNLLVEKINVFQVGYGVYGSGQSTAVGCNINTIHSVGLAVRLVRDCNVKATGNTAIVCDIVENSTGESVGADDYGISASSSVNNSVGRGYNGSGGISAKAVFNSTGQTDNAIGIAGSTVNSSRAIGGGGSSKALSAAIAIGCSTINGTVLIDNRYNMP